ncbi:MAG: AlpA family phage regulatory protein [Nitrospira sp.]|nr:AlpA family phage regulatory protein [Nitrospira sp.]MDE0485883.1 AlpA family phage regulatory protein [Nitrospira sp.]
MSTDQDVLLTRREVERRTGLSRSTLYRKMREGTFPVPLKVSERAVRWRESDIRAYVESRPRSYGETAP